MLSRIQARPGIKGMLEQEEVSRNIKLINYVMDSYSNQLHLHDEPYLCALCMFLHWSL